MATNPSKRTIRLLLIDDDPDDYLLTKEVVAEIPGGNYTLDWVRDYDSGIEAICKGEHDVYLVDYRIGEKSGIDLWYEARKRVCSGPMILLTGQSAIEIDLEAFSAGATDFLEKDKLDAKLLERSIRYAIRQHETERALEKKVEERTADLAAANEALHEAARRKDEYLATLGHELRNPLAPMRNALEIMRMADGSPEILNRARNVLERQVQTMVRLIEDLLDVARYFTGKFRINREPVDVRTAVNDAVEATAPLFERAHVSLSVTIPDQRIEVTGDRLRLAQTFTNILANSAKYTEAGGSCSIAVVPQKDNVLITIHDTGIGIPPELLPQVFQLFAQIDRTLNRAHGGLGIGLALVKRLVEMHEGTVTATSEGVGKGARFDILLPLRSG
jgi:signal transduction histidine kinase